METCEPESIRIDVTAEDIAAGKPRICARCPIALAIRRVTGIPVSVGATSVCTRARGRFRTVGVMPAEATDFIYRFDDGKDVDPFSFDLNLI